MTLDDLGLPVLKVMEDVTRSGNQHGQLTPLDRFCFSSYTLAASRHCCRWQRHFPSTKLKTAAWQDGMFSLWRQQRFERVANLMSSYTHPNGRISWPKTSFRVVVRDCVQEDLRLDPHGSTIAKIIFRTRMPVGLFSSRESMN